MMDSNPTQNIQQYLLTIAEEVLQHSAIPQPILQKYYKLKNYALERQQNFYADDLDTQITVDENANVNQQFRFFQEIIESFTVFQQQIPSKIYNILNLSPDQSGDSVQLLQNNLDYERQIFLAKIKTYNLDISNQLNA